MWMVEHTVKMYYKTVAIKCCKDPKYSLGKTMAHLPMEPLFALVAPDHGFSSNIGHSTLTVQFYLCTPGVSYLKVKIPNLKMMVLNRDKSYKVFRKSILTPSHIPCIHVSL